MDGVYFTVAITKDGLKIGEADGTPARASASATRRTNASSSGHRGITALRLCFDPFYQGRKAGADVVLHSTFS